MAFDGFTKECWEAHHWMLVAAGNPTAELPSDTPLRQLAVIQAPLSRLGDTVRRPRGSARAFHAPNACEITGELG